ncbi:tyrosine-type recombinase/integrase [Halobacillus sp. A5]|uniref:tyrosine-type recombinase/integrase n=1 Tax=Halobacillus sp. A5 TaxID=2880263 RepID=UPI0020A690E5|nr:tyrosine-type recombinase/integrase [Halobacillus sp. A5]MCP3025391.1 tyrosine-type recombinase/integrase [Halobacillus sp. A5]
MPRPQDRKTKRYSRNNKNFHNLDDARNIVIKLKKLEGLSKNTIFNYEKYWNDMDRFFGEDRDVSTLTTDDIRDFITWQMEEKTPFLRNPNRRKEGNKGISISSVNTYISYGKASFRLLESEGITNNIYQGIKNLRQQERKIDVMTIGELNTIFRTFKKHVYTEFRDYVACHLMLDSFGRIESVLSVKVEDFDFNQKTVTFQRTKNKRVHVMPLSNRTLKLVEELIEETEGFDNDHLFLTVFGDPLTPNAFRKHFREIIERSGIKRRIHPHLYRHTASKMFLEQGGSLRVLQSYLSHADASTTAIYAHVLDDTIKKQHAQFSPINLLQQKKKTRTNRMKK